MARVRSPPPASRRHGCRGKGCVAEFSPFPGRGDGGGRNVADRCSPEAWHITSYRQEVVEKIFRGGVGVRQTALGPPSTDQPSRQNRLRQGGRKTRPKRAKTGKTTDEEGSWSFQTCGPPTHDESTGPRKTKSFKRPLQPKITENQRKHRLRFCKMVKNWTEEDFKRVVWSDESPLKFCTP